VLQQAKAARRTAAQTSNYRSSIMAWRCGAWHGVTNTPFCPKHGHSLAAGEKKFERRNIS